MITIKRSMVFLTLLVGLSAVPSLCARPQPSAELKSSAIEVEMIQPGKIRLPAEFQVALYENLIQELQKKSGFDQVYRDGDRNAGEAPDRVILHTTIKGFKKGSEMARDVTTVSGATSITVHCQFTNKEGAVLLERDIGGKVRFFGDNLKATNDFAKKAATVARENLSSVHKTSVART